MSLVFYRKHLRPFIVINETLKRSNGSEISYDMQPDTRMGYDWHVNRVTVTALLRLNRPINGTTAVFQNFHRFVKTLIKK